MTVPHPRREPSQTRGAEAMGLLPLPVRIGAICAFLLVGMGSAWAILARVPEQVEGIAVFVPTNRIQVARAPIDGTLLYQVPGIGTESLPAIQRRTNRLIADYWEDPDLIWSAREDQDSLQRMIRLVARNPIGQELKLGTTNGVPVAGGRVVAVIQNDDAQETLRNNLAQGHDALRIQADRRRRSLARIAALHSLRQLQSDQLQRNQEAIRRRREMLAVLRGLENRGGISRRQVLEESEQLENLQIRALTNRQERLESESRIGDESVDLSEGRNRRRQQLDALESGLIRHLARTTLFAPPGGAYIFQISQPNGAAVRRGEPLYQYTLERPALPTEVPLLLGSTAAPRVFPGMEVSLTPFGMVRARVGGIRGRVLRVGDVPVTAAALRAVTGFDAASETLLKRLPTAYLATVQLETVDGASCRRMASSNCYRWSDKRTPEDPVRLGTLAEVRVTTRYRHPVEYAMPALRRLLDRPN